MPLPGDFLAAEVPSSFEVVPLQIVNVDHTVPVDVGVLEKESFPLERDLFPSYLGSYSSKSVESFRTSGGLLLGA